MTESIAALDEDDIGRKSVQVNNRWMELMIVLASERMPWDGGYLRERSQPRVVAGDGSATGRRTRSCEKEALQSARYLSDNGASRLGFPDFSTPLDDYPPNPQLPSYLRIKIVEKPIKQLS